MNVIFLRSGTETASLTSLHSNRSSNAASPKTSYAGGGSSAATTIDVLRSFGLAKMDEADASNVAAAMVCDDESVNLTQDVSGGDYEMNVARQTSSASPNQGYYFH